VKLNNADTRSLRQSAMHNNEWPLPLKIDKGNRPVPYY